MQPKPTEPIREAVTKFGGQPVWLTTPQWPMARSDGKPMRFICQIALPPDLQCGGQRMAYVFMSDNVDGATYEAEGGDNAVILQPAAFEPHVRVEATSAPGPTLEVMRPGATGNRLVPVETELRVELMELPDEAASDEEFLFATRIGGAPGWMQGDDTPAPAGAAWRFLAQIDSGERGGVQRQLRGCGRGLRVHLGGRPPRAFFVAMRVNDEWLAGLRLIGHAKGNRFAAHALNVVMASWRMAAMQTWFSTMYWESR